MRRIAAAVLSVGLATGAAACSDKNPSGPDDTSLNPPSGIVVSNALATSSRVNSAGASNSPGYSASTVAYISALPGTFPGAVSVAVRNLTRNGASQSVQVIEGGFDPLRIDAEVGDQLSLSVSVNGGASITLEVKVPPRRPPVVVRTDPAKGRTDVALNVQVVVVFSEPVDRSSVTSSSLALLHDGVAVNGSVDVSADGLTAKFIPDSPLQPLTSYALVVNQAIRDLDGDALGEASTVTFTTAAATARRGDDPSRKPSAATVGTITGVVLGDDGNALKDALLSIVATSTFAPYQQMSFSRDEGSERSYSVASLHAGKWALTFSVIHPWTFVFPGLYLYADTTLIVDVVAGQTAVVPDLLMRSRPPLLLVGLETCPGLPDPPTLADWGWSCDGGYWGGAAALITVTGVAGTNTASVHREGMIGPAAYTRPASFWQNTPWSTYFDMEILGDYDVTIALTPDASRPSWRLVPWQTTSRRVTVGKGLSYTEFDFWSK